MKTRSPDYSPEDYRPGDLVRMDFPVDSYEDRFTGRVFKVISRYDSFVTVKNAAGSLRRAYKFRAASLVLISSEGEGESEGENKAGISRRKERAR